MKGDLVEIVVDTGHGTQTFEIRASRAGRRIEVTTARGVVEVTEVTRGGTPVRTGRFMASRVVALVEHPALEGHGSRVEVETRRRMTTGEGRRRAGEASLAAGRHVPADQLALLGTETSSAALLREIEADTADDLADG
jgi:hypothetical protein